jgi:hypothetical protein
MSDDDNRTTLPHLIGAPQLVTDDTEDAADDTRAYFDPSPGRGSDGATPEDPPQGPAGFDLPDPDQPDRDSGWPRFLTPLAIVLVVGALAAGAAFLGITVFGSPGEGSSDRRSAASPTNGTTAAKEPGATDGYARPSAIPDPVDVRPTDPTFSWWGDTVSENSLRYSPSIGTSGHPYFWNVSDDVSVAGAINTIEGVRLAEEAAKPDKARGTLGGTVVFAFGNTEEVTAGNLTALRSAVGPERTLILVGVGALNNRVQPWRVDLNERYRKFADDNVNTRYVDWQKLVDAHPDYVSDSGNLTQSGTAAWSNAVNQEINDVYR